MDYVNMLVTIADKLKADPSLKQKLLNSPKETVKAITGMEVPGKITFHVPKENVFTFVIPMKLSSKVTLDDDDLDTISGGAQSKSYPNLAKKLGSLISMATGYAAPGMIPGNNQTIITDRLNGKGGSK